MIATYGKRYFLCNGTLVVESDLTTSIDKVKINALLGDVDLSIGEPLVEMEIIDC